MAARPSQPDRYPCGQCGADLRFAPGQTRLVCSFCGHEQDIPPVAALPDTDGETFGQAAAPWGRAVPRERLLGELDLHAAIRNALPVAAMEETRVTACTNCGAQVEFDGPSHATECPFCATPVVADTGTQRHIKPQALVPFQLTEPQARASMGDWLGRLWFAPNGLQDYARRGRKLQGLYVPYWTYDADTRSRYRGQRGDAYYETHMVTVNVNGRNERRQQQVRKIRWSGASGQVARSFDDVLVMASTSLPRDYADGLQPWDLSALTAYRADYLSGFRAEGYTVALQDGALIAREIMDGVIAQDIRQDIGGDEQRIEAVDTDLANETFKHILLPIWMAAYRYRGKSYRFIVNAQTGKVQGERPWSAWKIAFAVLLAAIVMAGIAYLANLQQ